MVPPFTNPYPTRAWERVHSVAFLDSLDLRRPLRAVRPGLDLYVVLRPYRIAYRLDDEPRRLFVPAGLVTDLCSRPAWAAALVDRVGPHLPASIVHDWLYVAWQGLDRDARPGDRVFADKLFRAGMRAAGVAEDQVQRIYAAVRIGGGAAYAARSSYPDYVAV